jgi:hypothetical protein
MSDKLFNRSENIEIVYFPVSRIKEMYTGICAACNKSILVKPVGGSNEVFASIDKDGIFLVHADCEFEEFEEE